MRKILRATTAALLVVLTLMLALPAPASATSLTLNTSSAGDNMRVGFDSNGSWSVTNAYIGVGYSTGSYYRMVTALRFPGVSTPRGSQITGAYLVLTAYPAVTSGTVVNSVFQGLAVDNAVPLADYSSLLGQIKTNAIMPWQSIPPWNNEAQYSSPNLSSIINEIVNRPGWVQGNSLTIVWSDETDQTPHINASYRIAYSYAANPAKAPQLRIEYQVGTGGYNPYTPYNPPTYPPAYIPPTDTDLTSVAKQLTDLAAQEAKLLGAVAQLQTTVTQLQTQVTALPTTVGAANDATSKTMAAMTASVTQTLQLVNTMNMQLGTLKDQIPVIGSSLTALKGTSDKLLADTTAAKASIAALKESNDSMSGRMTMLLVMLLAGLAITVGGFVYLAKKLGL